MNIVEVRFEEFSCFLIIVDSSEDEDFRFKRAKAKRGTYAINNIFIGFWFVYPLLTHNLTKIRKKMVV